MRKGSRLVGVTTSSQDVSAVRAAIPADRIDLSERLSEDSDPRTAREHNELVASRATIAEAKGEFDQAAELYSEAATQWAHYGFVLEHGLALLARGAAL